LIMGPNAELAVVKGTDLPNQDREGITFKLDAGTLHFTVVPSSLDQRLRIHMPHSLVSVTKGKGALAVANQDHISYFDGPLPVLVKNLASGQDTRVSPKQIAVSSAHGEINVTPMAAADVERFAKDFPLASLPLPAQIQKPPLPTIGPVTLEEQVKTPWPILPPVDQVPHLWLHKH
jgi:hypothetical protein